MSKLPPVEKLPLALRKNVRDEWDNKKSNAEKELSDVLGTPWTVDVNPNQLYAYAAEGYAKESLGNCIYDYFTGAIQRLKDFSENMGEEGLKELNSICHAHVATIDLDDAKRFSYCGVDIHEGSLRLLFAPGCLGTNIDDALDRDVLLRALNDAPAPPGEPAPALSFAARSDVRREYDPKIDEVQSQIAQILAKPDLKLSPNFEDTFARLSEEGRAAGAELRADWQGQLGCFTRLYWEGLVSQLRWQKFEEDELLQEGFHEAVHKGEIAFRIVDKLKEESYCEIEVEEGVLYLQCTTKTWGVNIDSAAQKLVDKL